MRKITITSLRINRIIWILVLYLLLSVIAVSFSFYQVKQQELNKLTRSLYNMNSISFVINNLDILVDWRKLKTTQPFTTFNDIGIVYRKIGDELVQYNARGIYYHKNTYKPPMISGRFFEEADFYQEKRLAVIGKNVEKSEDNYIEQNGKKYYVFKGVYFEIIGTMGASYSSKIDDMILFNLDAIEQEEMGESAVYVMNIGKNPISNGSLQFGDHTVSVDVIDKGDLGVQRFLSMDVYQLVIFLLLLLILVSLTLLFTQYWLGKKSTEIRILWQLGIPIGRAYQRYAITLVLIASGCYLLVGLLSYWWLPRYLQNPQAGMMHTLHLIVGYGLILLSAGISMWLSFRKSIRQRLRKG
ncbi:ABC transporter permease [Desmospora profundinema]|uniref:Cell division protein FtsL n=1 Tax=Desmospora profundinema TaxID=1571184 RepID=A0ABU1IPE5_9BACL|nr:ABC transporter permease [Desmospora profundinema]MDR6226667.1 cell division protein FtsL [Desmospora profundinema]